MDSALLKGNPLGDPHQRPLLVYVPPGYDAEPERRYPVVYVVQGYSGHVGVWSNRLPFRQPYPELIDSAVAQGDVEPTIVVFVDGWTAYGGSQFLDSPGTGSYHSYLCDEVVPWVDTRYRTVADPASRAITGKSSGGYAAMVTPMLRPDLFGLFATHAGDALFDVGYRAEMPRRARILRDRYAGSYERFLSEFHERLTGPAGSEQSGPQDGDLELIEVYAYSSAYSADPDGTVQPPFDDLGAHRPDVWERWLAWDPVVMASQPDYAEALRSMRAVWIDAGNRDEYFLDLGAAAFRRAVSNAGVPDERVAFELIDATHALSAHRYVQALAWLRRRMVGTS